MATRTKATRISKIPYNPPSHKSTPSMTIDATHIPSKLLLQLDTKTVGSPMTTTPPNRPSTPTSFTAPLTTFATRPRSCYLCDEQNPGDFSPTIKHLEKCVLCSRDFCPIHHAVNQHTTTAPVCSTNHSQHYHSRLARARSDIVSKYGEELSPSYERDAEEVLVTAGIYPSLGERERTIWRASMGSRSAVRGQTLWSKELKGSRPGNAEDGHVHQMSTPIETKDWVGADIAV